MLRTCSANKEWTKVHALWPLGQVRAVRTERADWTSDHCHEKRREKRRERERERERRKRTTEERKKKERREREKGRERRDEREIRDPLPSLLLVCRFKTLPCVPAKRAHVFNMRALCQYTRRRFERTHGGILNLHTGVFRVPSRATHTTHTTTHHTPHTTDTTQHTT